MRLGGGKSQMFLEHNKFLFKKEKSLYREYYLVLKPQTF